MSVPEIQDKPETSPEGSCGFVLFDETRSHPSENNKSLLSASVEVSVPIQQHGSWHRPLFY